MTKKALLKIANRLLLPVTCLGCGEEGDWICSKCLQKLRPAKPVICVLCGKAADKGLCLKCQKSTKLDGVVTFFSYQEKIVQDLIKTAKYAGNFDALKFFGEKYGPTYRRFLEKGQWVFCYIPISAERLKKRGFNQAEELAHAIGEQDFPVRNLLKKIKDTPQQVKQNRKIRLKNVRGSLAIRSVTPAQVVICDDVITTGSTLKEAAILLKKHGAKKVIALTIAHG
jgi:ComF family protein